ncbi:MAG: hypothetical protein LBP56_07940 [Odoribacteraceae bacterium]|jgi:hypothetical protein|nr:hypothetical protein [Odoribacteraceae bacterium]
MKTKKTVKRWGLLLSLLFIGVTPVVNASGTQEVYYGDNNGCYIVVTPEIALVGQQVSVQCFCDGQPRLDVFFEIYSDSGLSGNHYSADGAWSFTVSFSSNFTIRAYDAATGDFLAVGTLLVSNH